MIRYLEVQKVLYAILIASRKVCHYFQAHEISIVTSYPLKVVLHIPNRTGNIAEWAVELAKFELDFLPRHAATSQVLADFVADWTLPLCNPGGPGDSKPQAKASIFTEPHWTLFIDGSSRKQGAGVGVLLLTPDGEQFNYMVHLDFKATNNMAEYEALVFGLSTMLSLRVRQLVVKGDTQLIIKQVKGECSCNDPQLGAHMLHEQKMEKDFEVLDLQHIPRANNAVTDELSTKVSMWAPVPKGVFERRLQRSTARPAKPGAGDEISTSKLAVLVALFIWSPPSIICVTRYSAKDL
jgi:ribonuclease HI